jgi:hypothetical protein
MRRWAKAIELTFGQGTETANGGHDSVWADQEPCVVRDCSAFGC